MKLPLRAIRSTLLPFVAMSSLFLSPVSAEEALESQDFITASRYGDIGQVELLLEQEEGIDVNAENFYEEALMWALMHGRTDVVQLLLEQEGIDVNAENFYEEALMWASMHGRTNVVRLLLEQEDFDVNAENFDGGTAWGYVDIVQLLFLEQEDNVKNFNGDTALMWGLFLWMC